MYIYIYIYTYNVSLAGSCRLSEDLIRCVVFINIDPTIGFIAASNFLERHHSPSPSPLPCVCEYVCVSVCVRVHVHVYVCVCVGSPCVHLPALLSADDTCKRVWVGWVVGWVDVGGPCVHLSTLFLANDSCV